MTKFIWALALFLFIISYLKDSKRSYLALRKSGTSLYNLSSGVFSMIAILGLSLAVFPEYYLVKILNLPGTKGLFFASTIGALINIPGPIAFPFVGSLLKMGVRIDVLASFVTTLTMVSFVSSPIEILTFGKRFTWLRQFLSFLGAVFIGLMMGALM